MEIDVDFGGHKEGCPAFKNRWAAREDLTKALVLNTFFVYMCMIYRSVCIQLYILYDLFKGDYTVSFSHSTTLCDPGPFNETIL